ncbi:MAG: T9SS type A sorting domain-containing protein, partial [Hymenobacter sp.]
PYSKQYGQALAPNADGGWTSAVGGNGGNLSRTYYEQFTVTAAAGGQVRLDSLLLTAYVNLSTTNTKLAVVYSRSNFRTDSADVSGGVGPTGVLLSSANGGFLTPVLLTTSNTYRFNFLSAGGLPIQSGQTLTFRLYFSCGSSTLTTRFALLKNVLVKGEASVVTATRAGSGAGRLQAYPNPGTDGLTVAHPAASLGATLVIFSLDGRQVTRLYPAAGTQETRLPLQQLASGTYLVHYTDAGGTWRTTISKQ